MLSKDGALNELPVAGMRGEPACGFWEVGCASNIHSNAVGRRCCGGWLFPARLNTPGQASGFNDEARSTRCSSKSGAKGFQASLPLQVPGRAVGV